MEVTRHNYREALKQMSGLLADCDFVSFDTELTGLGRSLGDKNHDLDTPKERYQKASKRVKEYGLIQIGISIFRFCKSSKKYLNATYCFYLSGKKDASYRYDTSSMMFLAENGFDFNKVFQEGLTFISMSQEAEIRKKRGEKLMQERDITSSPPVKLKDDKAKTFVRDSIEKVTASKTTRDPVVMEGRSLNGFLRKVLFNNVAPMFPTSHFQNVAGSSRDIKVLHFDTDDEKKSFLEKQWEEELFEQIGFTHFMKAILESRKPLVGHNLILDILHLVDKFVCPLPEHLGEFKTVVKANLPHVYDTKLFARDPPFSANIANTALACLYQDLVRDYSPPSFEAETGCQSYDIRGEGQAHDGGFDAFMTGVCFVVMMKTLDRKQFGKTDLMKSKHLENYANRINFMGSHDIPFIDLNRTDVIPKRSHIYSLTCPANWTQVNVRNVFGALKGYKTVWVSDTQLYVIPLDEGDISRTSKLLEGIRATCPPNAKVGIYHTVKGYSNGNNNNNSATKSGPPILRGTMRPSSIALKRRSDAKEMGGEGESVPEEGAEAARNLKRLKSVGSELLSNMTLESPMAVEKNLPGSSGKEFPSAEQPSKPVSEASDVFSVPDDW